MAAPNSPQSNSEPERDLRCHCGSLMARLTARGIELKCRRCKRLVVLGTSWVGTEWVPVHQEDAMRH
jgi:hypothetical protein